jgi:hypothetical protein
VKQAPHPQPDVGKGLLLAFLTVLIFMAYAALAASLGS